MQPIYDEKKIFQILMLDQICVTSLLNGSKESWPSARIFRESGSIMSGGGAEMGKDPQLPKMGRKGSCCPQPPVDAHGE